MNAKEMFEELGFILLKEEHKRIGRRSWNYQKDYITYYNDNFYDMIIKFSHKYTNYTTIKFSCGDDSDREHSITLGLHIAITQQMKELRFLDD